MYMGKIKIFQYHVCMCYFSVYTIYMTLIRRSLEAKPTQLDDDDFSCNNFRLLLRYVLFAGLFHAIYVL